MVISLLLTLTLGFQEPWGKDQELLPPAKKQEETTDRSFPLTSALISLRQNYLTKIDGPRSHYRPTSSEYMRLSIKKFGFLFGFTLGCDRLMRENEDPWVYPVVQDPSGECYKWDPIP